MMEDKKMLNSEELEKVSGGAGNITHSRIHMDCGNSIGFGLWVNSFS